MFCPKCGAEFKEGAVFCHVCGYKTGESSENKTPNQEPPKQEAPKTETPNMEEKMNTKTFTDVKSDEVIANVKSGSLFKRVFAIMFSPVKEWDKVAQEKPKIPMIIFGYLLILSIVAFTAIIIGDSISWWGAGRYGYRPSFILPVFLSLVKLVVLIATPVIAAIIINLICPAFKIEKSFGKLLQLTAYSFTPVYISMTISWIPGTFIDFLVNLIGLYGVLILLLGYKKVLTIPTQKQVGFFFTAAGILYGVYYLLYLTIYIVQMPFWGVGYGYHNMLP
jgi:uncharacterized Zn finger protein (UPF0148 family)